MSDDFDNNDDNNIINHPSITDRKLIEKVISHPCEKLFNIKPNTTSVVVPAPRTTELVETPLYDSKDIELELNFQEIYDVSMDAFDELQGGLDEIEGKYRARNSEVAIQMLNTALAAAKEKARMKEHKDKLRGKGSSTIGGQTGGTTNNTQINITPAELVKMLAEQQSPVNNNNEYVDVDPDHNIVQTTRTKMQRPKKQPQEPLPE